MSARPKIRCAVYTRKSSEEGLEQDFNSLDAQAEACAAYIASQKHEGWVELPARYDDGGLSGGTLERPALQRLIDDIAAGRVDRVVIYMVDRLTRSLTDFSKLVERFDAAGCSFVSVTQSFNTATSMGRLTLNMLLSFAQFEREVTAERIRDKIAASKRRGMWMGGLAPLGYDARERALVVNAAEAGTVRTIFALYNRLGCVREVKAEADRRGLVTKRRVHPDGRTTGGVAFSRGRFYHLLANPVYVGRIRHGSECYDGLHEAIVDRDLWDRVQERLVVNASRARRRTTAGSPSPLAGKLADETGDPLTPSHANKKGRRYRYYVSRRLIARSGEADLDGWRLPAPALEGTIADLIRRSLADPAAPARLIRDPGAAEIARIPTALEELATDLAGAAAGLLLATLVARGAIAPGTLSITIDADAIAARLGIAPERIDPDALRLTTGFALRRRGVEARLVLDDPAPRIDRTLLRNLAQGRAWFEKIMVGTPMSAIAIEAGVSQRRVARLVDLAILAPDIVEAIVAGRQPLTLTSDALVRARHRPLWSDQRRVLLGGGRPSP